MFTIWSQLIFIITASIGLQDASSTFQQHPKRYEHSRQFPEQASVLDSGSSAGDSPDLQNRIKSAVRDLLIEEFPDFSESNRGVHGHHNVLKTDSLLTGSSLHYDDDEHHDHGGAHEDGDYPLHEATGRKTRRTYDFTQLYHVGLSCHDIQANQGARISGVYLIHPPNLSQGPWRVYCDLETDGGGWMVFQVRDDVEPRENFMRGWEDYKVGFGDFDREFWLGNILIWALTNVDNETRYELAVDMEDWSSNRRFARYRNFRLGSERDSFSLYHGNLFYGNAGDSLYSHNGLPFSTFDVDNDKREGDFAERSCARLYKGGWWYGNCHDSNLNGWNLGGPHRSFADGINWYTWTGYNYSLKKTVMKIRPQIHGTVDYGYSNNYLGTSSDVNLDHHGLHDDLHHHLTHGNPLHHNPHLHHSAGAKFGGGGAAHHFFGRKDDGGGGDNLQGNREQQMESNSDNNNNGGSQAQAAKSRSNNNNNNAENDKMKSGNGNNRNSKDIKWNAKEFVDDKGQRSSRRMQYPEDLKFKVPELLDESNTLTNPDNFRKKFRSTNDKEKNEEL